MTRSIEVCVVAHNEAQFIETCLGSIEIALSKLPADYQVNVHIVNNGSTDNSDLIIDAFCAKRSHFDAVHIALGDKSNAWNVAIYERVLSEESLVVFIDGDCTINEGSIEAMVLASDINASAYLLAAVPEPIGRHSENTIKETMAGRALSGNFYGITPLFHGKIKSCDFHLPVGLIGDDSLLAWVASHDFALSNGVQKGKLVGVKQARFGYHRLIPNSLSNIRMYWRRLQRYSLRHLQQCCIKQFLLHEDDKFAALPREISALYRYHLPEHIRQDSLLNNYLDKKSSKQLRSISSSQ